MKYCPQCGTEFDEEVIQFCTKDGSPLVEKDEPRFTALPSETSEDAGEDTVIRRRNEPAGATQAERGERIVIPATTPAETRREQQVRSRPSQAYYAPPPQQPNTGKVVALTILGTVAAIGFGALLFWALSRNSQPSNINVNTNPPNMNVNNANGFDSNFNFNANVNFPPANIPVVNINANVKTPTPTPKPSPSVTPSVVPTVTPERTPRPSPSVTPRSSPTPTPRTGPRPPGNLGGE